MTSAAPRRGGCCLGSFVPRADKHVQHLEGGILRDVLVKEGDLVESETATAQLDDTAATSKLRRLQLRNHRLSVMKRGGGGAGRRSTFTVPDSLAADAMIRGSAHHRAAGARAACAPHKLTNEEEVLRKRSPACRSTGGYNAQADSTKERLSLFTEELRDKQRLLAQQLVRRGEVLALRRSEAALTGDLGETLARLGDVKERIARAEQQIAQLRSAAMQKTIEELRTTETELDDLQEQIRAARNVVERIEVRAPVRGIVVKLNHHTPGGVVGAGAVILELLPVNDELVIEARLDPSEIWHVKNGQEALVRLTALNQRLTPMVQGKVIYLSATHGRVMERQLQDEPCRSSSAVLRRARCAWIKGTARKVHAFQPTPGMPADVFIKTGQRTFFDYIMRPVWDSFSRAFRES